MPENLTGSTLQLNWAIENLEIALAILDNPGGGLVFGYQALGQVRAHLAEANADRWRPVTSALAEAERQAVWRNYGRSRELVVDALTRLREELT